MMSEEGLLLVLKKHDGQKRHQKAELCAAAVEQLFLRVRLRKATWIRHLNQQNCEFKRRDLPSNPSSVSGVLQPC